MIGRKINSTVSNMHPLDMPEGQICTSWKINKFHRVKNAPSEAIKQAFFRVTGYIFDTHLQLPPTTTTSLAVQKGARPTLVQTMADASGEGCGFCDDAEVLP